MTKKRGRPLKQSGYEGGKISDFCINVSKKRVELGFSQQELADKIGVDRTWITKLERGTFPIDPNRIIAISRALDVTIDWLFTHGMEG